MSRLPARTPLLLAVAATLLATPTLHADMYKLTVTGTVDLVDPLLAPFINDGDPFTYEAIYETDTLAEPGSTSNSSVFHALISVSFSIGAHAYTSLGAAEIQMDNFPPNTDRLLLLSRASDGLTGAVLGGFSIDSAGPLFLDATNAAIPDALVLPTTLNLADWTGAGFGATFTDGVDFPFISGDITSASLVIIPEPATLAALALTAPLMLRRHR